MDGMTRIITAAAGNASYRIMIGGSILREALAGVPAGAYESIVVVASSRVYGLHRDYIDDALGALGGRCSLMLMDDGEENKNYAYAGRFLEQFLESGMTRKSAVIGVGGGVVGDFAGYCAAVFMRGVPVIHVPTTLLAMVDSSIGGKVAVNLSAGKNIAGMFHQPAMVVSDARFLSTLPDKEFGNGLAEALKHGCIGEEGTLTLLEENDRESIRAGDRVAALVALSATFKSRIVCEDERERDLRAILNFGHTVGHAIESSMAYRGITHGEAVAAGMRVKIEAARRTGDVSGADADRVFRVIDRFGLMPRTGVFDIDAIPEHMRYDKKNFGGAINFVMLRGLGNPIINQRVPGVLMKEVMMDVLC
jgi:3-dehydroquinate synthase